MFRFLLTVLMFVSATSSLSAADACKDDAKTYCSDAGFSPSKVTKCLKKYKEESSKCKKDKSPSFPAKMMNAMQACKGDVDKFCSKADGFEQTKKCLLDHKTELTALCKAQVTGS